MRGVRNSRDGHRDRRFSLRAGTCGRAAVRHATRLLSLIELRLERRIEWDIKQLAIGTGSACAREPAVAAAGAGAAPPISQPQPSNPIGSPASGQAVPEIPVEEAPPEIWLVVFAAVDVLSVSDEPLWTAEPGEWYAVYIQIDGWVLGRWESDPPEWLVWIALGPNVGLSTVFGAQL